MRVFWLAAICCLGMNGQDPTFNAQAPLVIVPVTVTSFTGERLLGLDSGAFTLFDNGKQREITVEPWSTYESHIALAVVLQTSSISKAALLKVKKMAATLDTITGEGGVVALIAANREIETKLDFTNQWEPIQETFEKLKAGGGSTGRSLDGVDAAIDLLNKRPRSERRIVLLISEAKDRGSKAKASDVVTRAQQANVTIYTVTYSAYVTPFTARASELGPPGEFDLMQVFYEIKNLAQKNIGLALAEYTGGRHFSFETVHRLEQDLFEIGKEVHSQYLLSFAPAPEASPAYHELRVSVSAPVGAVVRSRPGYWNASVTQPR